MPPFIRPCDPDKDEERIQYICRETVDKALAHEPACSIAPFIWAVPYVRLYPDYGFVLDSGDGTAVGYILGVPDNRQFLARYLSDYIPTLDPIQLPRPSMDAPAKWAGDELPTALLQLLYSPDKALLHDNFPQLLEQFPAHLHIDLLPEYQRQGYGRLLMDHFLARLRAANVKGVHLVMAEGNHDADAFYQRMGFDRFSAVLGNIQDKEAEIRNVRVKRL